MTKEIWDRVNEQLQKELGNDAYKNWIQPLSFRDTVNDRLILETHAAFFGNYVDRNFGKRICQIFTDAGSPVNRIEFKLPEGTCSGEPHAKSGAKSPKGGQDTPLVQVSVGAHGKTALDKRFTFDRFVVGKPNELAHAASRRVAESTEVSFNPLFLYGGVGLGKTHLMHAIAWETKLRNPSARILYISAEEFTRRFIAALRFKDMLSFKDQFRSVDLLMVDDVQFIARKESTQDEFFHTFNALIDQSKQIVISGDRSPGEIEGIDERIKSRLQWGLVVDIHPTDYELRLGILQSKAEANREHYPNVVIQDGVMEFLAHRISSNVRVLEGALTRVFAFSELVGRTIDIEMAREVLSDILRVSQKKVTVEEIIRKVAEHFNLKVSDILSHRRPRNIARPRQIAMYLAKNLTSQSLPDIGRRFGGRDHTPVIHAVKTITNLKETDAAVAEDVELLRRMLEG